MCDVCYGSTANRWTLEPGTRLSKQTREELALVLTQLVLSKPFRLLNVRHADLGIQQRRSRTWRDRRCKRGITEERETGKGMIERGLKAEWCTNDCGHEAYTDTKCQMTE